MGEQQRMQLLSSQFDLQDLHYRTYFPATDRRIVTTVEGHPLGRLYLLREDPMWKMIDLSLLPEVLGAGIGGQLVDGMLAEAEAARKPITLHCATTNPGFEMYKAKGFREVREEGGDWVMEWWPSGRV